ncbi:MAG: DUF11 domain-containing protein [Chloroflexi bacterium]|nr:DUF11 domain-containing protein [Chloroflexota bacterium]
MTIVRRMLQHPRLRFVGSIALLYILGSISVFILVAQPANEVTICHHGQVTLTLPYQAVFGPGGHLNEDGSPRPGHESDYLGACASTNTPEPTSTPLPTAVPTAVPQPTNTPIPPATNTPVPADTATNTPVPTDVHTNTPVPTAALANTATPPAKEPTLPSETPDERPTIVDVIERQAAIDIQALCTTEDVRVVAPLWDGFYMEGTASGSDVARPSLYVGYSVRNFGLVAHDVWVSLVLAAGEVTLAPTEDGLYYVGNMAPGETTNVYFFLTDATDNGNKTDTNQGVEVNIFYDSPASPEICDYAHVITDIESTIKAAANKINAAVTGPTPPELGGIVTMTVVGETGTTNNGSQLVDGTPLPRYFRVTPASLPNWPADSYQLFDVKIDFWNGTLCPAAPPGAVPASAPTHTYFNDLDVQTPATPNMCYRVTYLFKAVNTVAAPGAISPVNFISSGTQIKYTAPDAANPPATMQPIANNVLLSKSVSPTVLANGGTVTYTITIANSGSLSINIDTVLDIMPAGATYVANSTQFNGSPYGNPIQSLVGGQTKLQWNGPFTIPAGGSRTLVYQANVPSTPGNYLNQAWALIGGSGTIDTSIGVTTLTPDAPAQANVFVPSNTPTNTPTFTPSFTFTPSNTPTFTPTDTPTQTFTPSNTPTDTPTQTFTPSNTPTDTPTQTFTPSNTPTDTPTPTFTPSNTPTDTPTQTFTPSNTPTDTPTQTFTPSNTPTDTPTQTFTPSNTPTDTPTQTFTPSNTPPTPDRHPADLHAVEYADTPPRPSRRPIRRLIRRRRPSRRPIRRLIRRPRPSRRPIRRPILRPRPLRRRIHRPIPDANLTPSNTPTDTPTQTFTPSNTPTDTPTQTFTPSNTPTDTPTQTFTPSNTPTDTPTQTFTPSNTPTDTPTQTFTPSNTPTDTPTQTFTPSNTPTDTPTQTFTPSNTPTDTPDANLYAVQYAD